MGGGPVKRAAKSVRWGENKSAERPPIMVRAGTWRDGDREAVPANMASTFADHDAGAVALPSAFALRSASAAFGSGNLLPC